jgi:predicted thioesterase
MKRSTWSEESRIEDQMDALGNLTIGMSAEMQLLITRQMTIGHFVPGMPYVYATPMMVLHMEMAAGSAIADALQDGFVSVGMEVNVRHLAATPIAGAVRIIARVTGIGAKSIIFDVEAWNDVRKIGEGTHRRGIVNVLEFEKRFRASENAPA